MVEPNKMDTCEWIYCKRNGQYLKMDRQRNGQTNNEIIFLIIL